MRLTRTCLASLFAFAALAACSNETIVVKAAPAGPDDVDPGAGADGGDGSEPCAPVAAAPVLDATIFGRGALDYAGDTLGFAYVDAQGTPTIQILARDAAAPAKVTWPDSVRVSHYGSSYVTTSLAHNGERFGFGWYTERPFASTDGVWSTMFATATTAGAKTLATPGNDDTGRSGSDDMVQASGPRAMPSGDGFMLAWQDTRTKEPRVTGVNLALWGGIYARAYDAEGRGAPRDVQIAQPTRPSGLVGVTDGVTSMPIWTVDDGKFKTTLHARAETTFTPAEAPPALATFESYSASGLAAARGADGTVLAVVTRKDKGDVAHVGSVTIGMSASAKSAYADWSEVGLTDVAVSPTATGFVVAALETTGAEPDAKRALRFFWLDASGARIADAKSDLALGADVRVTSLAVHASGSRVEAAVLVAPATATNDGRAVRVHRAVVCAAR